MVPKIDQDFKKGEGDSSKTHIAIRKARGGISKFTFRLPTVTLKGKVSYTRSITEGYMGYHKKSWYKIMYSLRMYCITIYFIDKI